MLITYILLGINLLASLYVMEKMDQKYRLMLNPFACKHNGQWYRMITHAFIHADFMHLFFNLFVLYTFGRIVEAEFVAIFDMKGYYYFSLLFLGGIFFSTLPSFYKHSDNPNYYSLGASGAVSAVVFSFIILYPEMDLYLIFLPIPIPGFIFGGLYLLVEYFMSKRSSSRIAHDAHLFGGLFGIAFTLLIDFDLFYRFINKLQIFFSNL